MNNGHAIIVGGTRGLGLVIAKQFIARGLRVTLISRTPLLEPLDRTQHLLVDLEKFKGFTPAEMDRIKNFGPVCYLVLSQRYRGSGDAWTGEIQVTLNASKILIESLLESFDDKGDLSIVAASSVYAKFVGSSQPIGYHVAKAGLNALCRYYAWSLGSRGIRVNSVMPLSYIKDESRSYYMSQTELQNVYARFVPLQRMGDADDTANAVDFLCSEKSKFITGQSIFIDGGVSVVWPEETAKYLAGV